MGAGSLITRCIARYEVLEILDIVLRDNKVPGDVPAWALGLRPRNLRFLDAMRRYLQIGCKSSYFYIGNGIV